MYISLGTLLTTVRLHGNVRTVNDMPLDLEIAGAMRALAPTETASQAAPVLKRLRDSHHAVARLLAHGQTPEQVSLATGYAPSRISTLQRDPMFRELLAFYAKTADVARMEFEAQMEIIARDAAQAVHERILDEADEVPLETLADVFKIFADRAGFAPVTRSVNKNLNLNIGERLDAARRRREEAA